jgi:hypothetical protein
VPTFTPDLPNDKRTSGRTFEPARLAILDVWRRRRDSNPRDPFESNGFQDRRFQPLTHSSVFNSSVFCELAANL